MADRRNARTRLWGNNKGVILWLSEHALMVFVGLGFLVAVVVVIVSLCEWGQLDLTALFTGWAFLGALANLWFQGSLLARQQYENTFYRMLDQLRSMVDNIEFGQNWYRGKSVFKDCYFTLSKLYREDKTPDKKLLKDYKKNNGDYGLLENYFLYQKQVLKYIDDAPSWAVSKSEKERYASVLKAHTSKYELCVLKYEICIKLDKNEDCDMSFARLVNVYLVVDRNGEDGGVQGESTKGKDGVSQVEPPKSFDVFIAKKWGEIISSNNTINNILQ